MSDGLEVSANVRAAPDELRICAEIRWAEPDLTWAQIAQRLGKSERQIYRWRKTEAYELAFREAGQEYVERLAPAAVTALLKAWSKGNPAGALDVLRSLGFLLPERIEVEHSERSADIDRKWAQVVENLGIRSDQT